MSAAADKIVQALCDILDPIAYIERGLQEGERLNGQAALQQINSREFYLRIARKALEEFEAEKAQPAPADFENEALKGRIARVRLDLMAELREQGWVPEQPGAVGLSDDDIEWPDTESAAHSCVQEALSFGLSFDVIHRHMLSVMFKTAGACRAALATQPVAPGCEDKRDAERWRAMRELLVTIDWSFQGDESQPVAIFMCEATEVCAGPEGADLIADAAVAATQGAKTL